MIRLASVLVFALLVAAGTSSASSRPRAADIEAEIVCPVCDTTLDQSNATIAEKMKLFIRRRIAAGDSEQQIKDALVAEFGPGVLAEPPRGGFGALAWLLPLAVLLVGAVVVAYLVRSWTRRGDGDPPSGELGPELDRLVDEELARFDG